MKTVEMSNHSTHLLSLIEYILYNGADEVFVSLLTKMSQKQTVLKVVSLLLTISEHFSPLKKQKGQQ